MTQSLPVEDPVALTEALMRIGSVSGDEDGIAAAVTAALGPARHLHVERDGNCVIARTDLGRGRRVVVAGHIDTVPQPSAGPIPVRIEDGVLHGRGSVDMLGGVAMALVAAVTLPEPAVDVTYLFYDCEEVDHERNGLTRLSRTRPDVLQGDVAVLGEPTALALEGGCQGNVTIEVSVAGRAAHTARPWMGSNAVHAAAGVVAAVAAADTRRPVVDGLEYREAVQVVRISGGRQVNNVVPDSCTVVVNHRFAPDRTRDEALGFLAGLVGDHPWRVLDGADGARPGLDRPELKALADVVADRTGQAPRAKLGWTDVARFAALGIPAVNLGPGRPELAHADDEQVPVADLVTAADILRSWLAGG